MRKPRDSSRPSTAAPRSDTPAPGGAAPPPDPAPPDPSVPYYARTPDARAEREMIVKLVNSFGTHLICAKRTCQRAHACADDDEGQLPLCFWQHRGMIRMVTLAAAERLGLAPGAPGVVFPQRDDAADPAPPPGGNAPSVLGRLRKRGARIDQLAKPIGAGEDPWSHELDPDGRALFDEMAKRGG